MKFNSVKIVVILVFIVIMAGMLFNVDLPLRNSNNNKITLVIKSKYGTQWELISAGAKAAANEYGAELSILAPDYERDISSQKNLLLTAKDNKSNGIILAPIDDESLRDVINEVVNSGVPIMNIVTGSNNSDIYSSLVTNYIEVGKVLGSTIENEIGSDGRIIIVASEENSLATNQKLEGLLNYIEKETTIKVTNIIYTSTEIFSVERMFFEYLGSHQPDGIITLDQVTTLGVGKAAEALDKGFNIVGTNIYEDELYLIEKGYIEQVVNENFFAIGYLAVENSVNMVRDKGYIAHRMISPHVINNKNMYDPDVQKIIFPIR